MAASMTRAERGERERQDRIRRDLERLQRSATEAESAAATLDRMAGLARAERAELAGAEADGSMSADKVDRRALELIETERKHTAAAAQRREVAELHREKLRPLEEELAGSLYAAKVAAADRLVERSDAAGQTLLDALEAAAVAADNYVSARERVASALVEVDEQRGGLFDPDGAPSPAAPTELQLVVSGAMVAGNAYVDEVCRPGTGYVMLGWSIRSHLPHKIAFTGPLAKLVDLIGPR